MENKKTILILLVIALIVVAVVLDMKRREAADQLKNLTVRMEQLSDSPEQSEQAAKRIVQRVRNLIDLPTDVEPTVATIVDVETLKSRNPFYAKAKNGDHLIVTTDRAILYDPDRNIILDVVPVQIQPVGVGQ